MKTFTPLLLSSAVHDGYLLPDGYMTYVHSATKQLVFPNEANSAVMQLTTSAGITALNASNRVTTVEVSDVTVRLVTTASPTAGDLLLLYNGTTVGIYQFSGQWLYYGTAVMSTLHSSSVGSNSSTGFRRGLAVDSMVCQVVTISAGETMPSQLRPYMVYVDKVNSMIYFPYVTAGNMESPYAVAAIHSLSVAYELFTEMEVLVSPCGYNQTTTLKDISTMYKITYSSLTNPSIGQPVSIYSPGTSQLDTGQLMLTSLVIDYSTVIGVDEVLYQLTSGYYRGGNNLWDTVIAKNGTVASTNLTQITDTSPFAVCMTNLSIMKITTGTVPVEIFVYVGKPGTITADNILFSKNMTFASAVDFSNIRLSQGEALFVKTTKAQNYSYRVTQLGRNL